MIVVLYEDHKEQATSKLWQRKWTRMQELTGIRIDTVQELELSSTKRN